MEINEQQGGLVREVASSLRVVWQWQSGTMLSAEPYRWSMALYDEEVVHEERFINAYSGGAQPMLLDHGYTAMSLM